MTPVLIAALLAVLAIRGLQVPQVRTGLGAVAILAAALVIITDHAAVLIALAAALAAGTLAPVLLLHRFAVPVPTRARRA